jgi:uncharacterized protein DUF4760
MADDNATGIEQALIQCEPGVDCYALAALNHSHGTDWLPVVCSVVIGIVTLVFIWRQIKTADAQLATALANIQTSVNNHNKITDAQRKLAAASFIVTLETDAQYLEARRIFAQFREASNEDVDRFTDIVKARKEHRENRATEPPDGDDIEAEDNIYETQYQQIINYLNILENISIQIQRGAYDEQSLRQWHRGAFVRNVKASLAAINYIRKVSKNSAVFVEAEFLAQAWAEGPEETLQFGPRSHDLCAESKAKLTKILAEL